MFLSFVCRASVFSALFIVTETLAYRVVPNNYELDNIFASNMLNELLSKRHFRIDPTTVRNRQIDKLPTNDPFSDPPYTPEDHLKEVKNNLPIGEKKPKKDIAELALYPNLERILKRHQGYPERNAYVLDDYMVYED